MSEIKGNERYHFLTVYTASIVQIQLHGGSKSFLVARVS